MLVEGSWAYGPSAAASHDETCRRPGGHPMMALDSAQLLAELEPVVAANLDRHLAAAKEWMPHEYVPWGEGRDFVTDPWEIEQSKLSPVARTAFEVNLLTEDNLPSYHFEIASRFGRD